MRSINSVWGLPINGSLLTKDFIRNQQRNLDLFTWNWIALLLSKALIKNHNGHLNLATWDWNESFESHALRKPQGNLDLAQTWPRGTGICHF